MCFCAFECGFKARLADGSIQEELRLGFMDLVGMLGFDLARLAELWMVNRCLVGLSVF